MQLSCRNVNDCVLSDQCRDEYNRAPPDEKLSLLKLWAQSLQGRYQGCGRHTVLKQAIENMIESMGLPDNLDESIFPPASTPPEP